MVGLGFGLAVGSHLLLVFGLMVGPAVGLVIGLMTGLRTNADDRLALGQDARRVIHDDLVAGLTGLVPTTRRNLGQPRHLHTADGPRSRGLADHSGIPARLLAHRRPSGSKSRPVIRRRQGHVPACGKPNGGDLLERKATSVVVTAHQLADAPTRQELTELMNNERLDDSALERWKDLIAATGAVQLIEEMISDRVASAREDLSDIAIDASVRTALDNMAVACTDRAV